MEELLEVPNETDSLRENLKHMSNSHESQSYPQFPDVMSELSIGLLEEENQMSSKKQSLDMISEENNKIHAYIKQQKDLMHQFEKKNSNSSPEIPD